LEKGAINVEAYKLRIIDANSKFQTQALATN
ncbi:hypothetical protein LCGC14_1864390, partial [marine sediment metagenome]